MSCNIVQCDQFGGGSVIAWGGICMEDCTDVYGLQAPVQWLLGSSWCKTKHGFMWGEYAGSFLEDEGIDTSLT